MFPYRCGSSTTPVRLKITLCVCGTLTVFRIVSTVTPRKKAPDDDISIQDNLISFIYPFFFCVSPNLPTLGCIERPLFKWNGLSLVLKCSTGQKNDLLWIHLCGQPSRRLGIPMDNKLNFFKVWDWSLHIFWYMSQLSWLCGLRKWSPK